jgi:competence ComEA-like helix-hairpin-helix protein
MEDSFGGGLGFLGVRVLRLSLQDPFELRWTDAPHILMPTRSVNEEGWSGPTFSGLDKVLAEVEFDGRWFPVLGYREVGEGRIWFIGLNLLYYAQQTQATELVTTIRDMVLSDVTVSRQTWFDALPVQDWHADGNSLSFAVDAGNQPVEEALVSYTYHPRWKVAIDGAEVPFHEHEHLIKLALPPGVHRIEIRYERLGTIWPILGLGVGAVGIAFIVIGQLVEGRGARVSESEQRGHPSEVPLRLVPCRNCGFRFREILEQPEGTQHRELSRCPICHAGATQEGSESGERLTAQERFDRLAVWLHGYGYDSTVVHEQWGFPPEDFFLSDLLEPSSAYPSNGRLAGAGIHNRINLNLADATEIQSLPRIGPKLSQRIVEYRRVRGLIRDPDELLEIEGIGVHTLEAIRKLVVLV